MPYNQASQPEKNITASTSGYVFENRKDSRSSGLEHPANGALAQQVRASGLHPEGRPFDPDRPHQLPSPKPLCIDLFCGLGGWSEGFLANGYRCIGYDIEARDYGTGGYPGELILRDVRSIHGSEFKDATCIVASPPCQAYSYRAMPWSRAKALPPPDNTLFNACFRIQREAIEAAGHHIPLVVENVRGAQKWVGPARWHFGSFYLWGDVPALMPPTRDARKFHAAGSLWFDSNTKDSMFGTLGPASFWSSSPKRKAASAQIAKIPFPLADWIAKCFLPTAQVSNFPSSATSPGA